MILIGAGPAAVAALDVLPRGLRTCVVTGATATLRSTPKRVHPKIDAVAYERREPPGVTDVLPIADAPGARFFDTAIEGGLANYWGQQFVRYTSGDAWPRGIFEHFSDYCLACERVEARFALSPVGVGPDRVIDGGYLARTPRLLVGTSRRPSCGLQAMGVALREIVAEREATDLIRARARSFHIADTRVRVTLDDGQEIQGERLLLAAGVVGTLRLSMASMPDILAVRFRDHAPKMLYVLGTDRLLRREREDRLRHFNALTIERLEQDCSKLFASVYRMGDTELSLLTAAVGLPPMLRGMRAPSLASLVKPVQVWTDQTSSQYLIERGAATAVIDWDADQGKDPILKDFIDWLHVRGALVKLSHSQPGGGFHYHGGAVAPVVGEFLKLNEFLADRYAGRVLCADASALDDIGCRPNALTSMAAARALSRRAIGQDPNER